jgi:copper chaperone
VLDLTVEGMTCEHCRRAVTQALGALPGVASVSVDLAAGRVQVEGQPDPAAVKEAIAAEGYTVREP